MAIGRDRGVGRVREPDRAILLADLPDTVKRVDSSVEFPADKLRRAVIDYATAMGDGDPGRCHRTLEEVERALIAYAVRRHPRNQSGAAEYLGLHRNTLRNKLRDLGIDMTAGPEAV